MSKDSRSRRGGIASILAWLLLIWIGFALQAALWGLFSYNLAHEWGVRPHEWRGLAGIAFAPFLHAGLAHLLANSLALGILGLLALPSGGRRVAAACAISEIAGGLLAWSTGTAGAPHVGASGVAFGLIGFLLVDGLARGGILRFLVAIVVGLIFGGAILGVFATTGPSGQALSWQMHLGGLLGGAWTAWILRKTRLAD